MGQHILKLSYNMKNEMKCKKMPTQKKLKELLSYDRKYGLLKWKAAGSGRRSSLLAGYLNSQGYIHIGIEGSVYLSHRIIWVLVYGSSPKEIDHINHVRCDNRLKNLRSVNNIENSKNRRISTRNTSGMVGVHWGIRDRSWIASIGIDHKLIFLGSFHNFEQAVLAREKANAEYGFHSNHGK